MITKSIGLFRNLLNKREQLMGIIKTIAKADNVVVITLHETELSVAGYTDNDPTTLFMLGRATGYCIGQAAKADPNIDISEYLMQPNIVATGYLEKEGFIG